MKSLFILLGLLASVFALPTEEIHIISRLEPRHIELPLPEGAGPLPNGSNQHSSRIINGRDAAPGTLKYQAGLVIDNRGFCGGSLIRHNFVLTAAHCVDDASSTQVVLGAHDIHKQLNTQQVIVSRIHYVHYGWDRSTLSNDVALIKIRSVANNPSVRIIPLAPKNAVDFANSHATLSGWGRMSDDSNQIANYLQVVQLKIMTNRRCNLNFLGVIQSQHICTQGSYGDYNAGACNGDSGGPLVVSGLQVGIVSFGFPRCSAGMPSVYARVSAFADFIESVVERH
ncbi:unnamed protein product [Ceutorhynchus assimilis]|uniref:Peptidase S1 domain-containing protein n=1 Tax=Ceutorhynchus assimilis TaxID=467358 RepID=A0A9N9QN16_9CUCU|nr:unnamed protein product [Ceutorhynchus assimilis]